MAGSAVFTFGKHRDLTFQEVQAKDPGYCQWVKKLPSANGQLKEFQEFLKGGSGGPRPAQAPTLGQRPPPLPGGAAPARPCARPGTSHPASTDQQQAWRRQEPQQQPRPPQQRESWHQRPGKEALVVELTGASEFRIFSPHYLDSRLWHLVTGLKLGQWVGEKRHWIFPDSVLHEVAERLQNSPVFAGCSLELPPDWVVRRLPNFVPAAYRSQTPRAGQQNVGQEALDALPAKTRERLMPYQREGVIFGVSHSGRCLIGDEMGLGKTLQALGIAAYFKGDWPCLVIAPSSMRFIWRDQIAEWLELETAKVQVLKQGKDVVDPEALFVVISFHLIAKNEQLQLRAGGGNYGSVIVDESQFVKEYKSMRCKATLAVCSRAKRVVLLSGTPALNRAAELYTQLEALMPGEIPSFMHFARRYCEQVTQHFNGRDVVKWTGSRCKSELNLFLSSSVMIRRLKRDVLTQLPDKTRQRFVLDVSQMDKAVLKKLEQKMKEMEESNNPEKAEKALHSAAEFHKFAAEEAAKANSEKAKAFTNISELFKLSAEAKVGAVLEHVETLLDTDVKFLCFAHHSFMMDKVEDNLRSKKVGYIRIDGTTPQELRPELVEKFQSQDAVRVAVLSITACGQGLTLTAASHVVFAELYWVPGQLLQAEDRVHRLGQKNPCLIQYLIAPKTMDDRIFRMVDKKTCVVTGILDGVERGINVEPDEKEKAALKRKAEEEALAHTQDDEPLIELMGAAPTDGEHAAGGEPPATEGAAEAERPEAEDLPPSCKRGRECSPNRAAGEAVPEESAIEEAEGLPPPCKRGRECSPSRAAGEAAQEESAMEEAEIGPPLGKHSSPGHSGGEAAKEEVAMEEAGIGPPLGKHGGEGSPGQTGEEVAKEEVAMEEAEIGLPPSKHGGGGSPSRSGGLAAKEEVAMEEAEIGPPPAKCSGEGSPGHIGGEDAKEEVAMGEGEIGPPLGKCGGEGGLGHIGGEVTKKEIAREEAPTLATAEERTAPAVEEAEEEGRQQAVEAGAGVKAEPAPSPVPQVATVPAAQAEEQRPCEPGCKHRFNKMRVGPRGPKEVECQGGCDVVVKRGGWYFKCGAGCKLVVCCACQAEVPAVGKAAPMAPTAATPARGGRGLPAPRGPGRPPGLVRPMGTTGAAAGPPEARPQGLPARCGGGIQRGALTPVSRSPRRTGRGAVAASPAATSPASAASPASGTSPGSGLRGGPVAGKRTLGQRPGAAAIGPSAVRF